VAVLLLSQAAYYCAWQSNMIETARDVQVLRGAENPYYEYYDLFKSCIELLFSLGWLYVAWKWVKSYLAMAVSLFLVVSAWNQTYDFLTDCELCKSISELITLILAVLLSLSFYLLWRRNSTTS
jgi:hypothetical protein